jgi:hypothetical protein
LLTFFSVLVSSFLSGLGYDFFLGDSDFFGDSEGGSDFFGDSEGGSDFFGDSEGDSDFYGDSTGV